MSPASLWPLRSSPLSTLINSALSSWMDSNRKGSTGLVSYALSPMTGTVNSSNQVPGVRTRFGSKGKTPVRCPAPYLCREYRSSELAVPICQDSPSALNCTPNAPDPPPLTDFVTAYRLPSPSGYAKAEQAHALSSFPTSGLARHGCRTSTPPGLHLKIGSSGSCPSGK